MEVMIEIGHKAWKTIKPTIEGHTHEWTVFVQGVNGREIKHIIEKVIFHLPDNYQDSKQIREKPPFVVSESTSVSISIQIDVFFCPEAKLGKVNYIYDMHISDKAVDIFLMRKLTFSNPTEEFREKLLLAGGEIVDMQEKLPVMMGGLLNCQAEPDNEIIILNNADENATSNITYQKLDIMQELLKENENLKSANAEFKERIGMQKVLMDFFEDNFSCSETQTLNTTMGIGQLKKKIEADEREISTLNLQLQVYENALSRIKSKKKSKNDGNISVAAGKTKENLPQPTKYIPSPPREDQNISEISSLHKHLSGSTNNQNISETVIIGGTTAVRLNKRAVALNDSHDILSRNCFLSRCKNETQSLNDNLNHSENLQTNKNIKILDCHRNVSAAIASSVKSTNSCDFEKSVERNTVRTGAFQTKPYFINQVIEKPMFQSPIKANSSLNTSHKTITSGEKYVERSLAIATDSLNKSNMIIMGQKSANYNHQQSKNFEKIVERKTFDISVITDQRMNKTLEQFNTHVQKLNASPIKRTNIETCHSSSKGDDRELVYFGDIESTPGNTRLSINQKVEEFKRSYSQHIKHNASGPTLVSFLSVHCQKLVTELDRIKNSEFRKYRDGTNSLFYKLANIDTDPTIEESCKEYQQSLIDYFTNPKTFDMPTLIYVIVDYLCRERPPVEKLVTYIQDQNTLVFLTPSENCIVSALYEVDKKSLPHLNGLVRNTLNIIYRVIISKKNVDVNGLASLCRVFMEICKLCNDLLKPLYLCCELLALEHPLAPYLINSLAAIWRDPFKLNKCTDDDMVMGAIRYGMKEKPKLMDNNLWTLTQRLKSTYFPRPCAMNHHQARKFLTTEIVSRCAKGLSENLWMLALPLVIFVSKETWDWKKQFRKEYILPNLLQFSGCLNDQGFALFCNLYVDIFSLCPESPYEELQQYLANTSLNKGVKFIQDSAALALLKYIGVANKHIPALLRDWFLKNQDNPKLTFIVDIYCKKVMESRGSFLLWDDVLIS